jgi:hypothetical protein
LDVFDVSEYLDALALIHSCRLDQPDVVLAVLEGEALLFGAAIVDLFETVHKLRDLVIVRVTTN